MLLLAHQTQPQCQLLVYRCGVPRLGTQPPTSRTWAKGSRTWRSDAALDLLLRWLEELLIVRKMVNARPNIIMTHSLCRYGGASCDLQGRLPGRLRREVGLERAVPYTWWDTEVDCSIVFRSTSSFGTSKTDIDLALGGRGFETSLDDRLRNDQRRVAHSTRRVILARELSQKGRYWQISQYC
jgi:hypothetical protein